MGTNYNDNHWLFVEDDIDDQNFFKMAFKMAGIKNELVILNNGEDALQYITSTKKAPFVIISDINMPKMSGLELLKSVKQDNVRQDFKSIPFLIMSSSTSEVEIDHTYKMGAQGYFSKTVSVEEQVDLIVNIRNYWSLCRHPSYLS
jgi:CheY-like chemotaxis protein